jgi:hypothetical protein
LDITALEEWDRQNSVEECNELIILLQTLWGIVERSETFWAERMQHSVYWDSLQGVVIDRSKDSEAKGLRTSFDAVDPLLEQTKKYFDPRVIALPTELISLCNLYDRHVLRQKVIIQLSLPLSRRVELRSSGENTAAKDVDHIYLWYLVRGRDADEEFRERREFELAVEVDEDNVIIVPEEAEIDGMPYAEEGEDLTSPMDLNMGRSDYQPTWIAGAEVKQRSLVPCSATQPCDLSHLCLRCRARQTRASYEQWDLTDSRIAAHVLLH